MQHPDNIHNIRIAIVDSNILTCLGLQQLLGDLLPMADIVVFNSVRELTSQDTSQFIHFFVASRIYFENTEFFHKYPKKTIVLVNGEMSIKDIFTLNICQKEKSLVKDIMKLQHQGHDYAMTMARQSSNMTILSPREIEVAVLLSKGFINKEIADKLNISLSTIITHRKNIIEKLNARSLADIIMYCVINGFVNIEDL